MEAMSYIPILFKFSDMPAKKQIFRYANKNQIFRYANVNKILYDFNGDLERCEGADCNGIEYSVLRFSNGQY